MKTILKLGLVVLVALTTVNTYAGNDDFLLNVKSEKRNEISFSVNGIKRANVTIYDKDHNVIYDETLTGKEGLVRTYNLEEFPEGVYYLEVETNLKRVTHEIVVNNVATTLSRRSIAEVYKGSLKMKNENVASAN